jgi:hypothetical protein
MPSHKADAAQGASRAAQTTEIRAVMVIPVRRVNQNDAQHAVWTRGTSLMFVG